MYDSSSARPISRPCSATACKCQGTWLWDLTTRSRTTVSSVLGPVTQDSLPVAGPGLETSLPSVCWGSAEGGTRHLTLGQELSVLSSRLFWKGSGGRHDGGVDPGLSSAAPAALAFFQPFTSIQNQIRQQ